MTKEINNRLRELRESRNLSGTKIAEAVGISAQYYYDLEKGLKRLNEDTIRGLADFFDVSIDYLLGRSDEQKPAVFLYQNLRELRGERSYEEFSEYLKEKGKAPVSPRLLEQYEKGHIVPSESIIFYICKTEDLDIRFFYPNYLGEMGSKNKSNEDLIFMTDEIRQWVKKPKNYPLIELAYNASKAMHEKKK